jgi:hypothetical protein
MGFALQGLEPPERCRTCFQAVALAPLRKPLPSFSSEEEKEIRGVARPQSLAHHPGPYPPNGPKTATQADALLGFGLPRVLSPCNRRHPGGCRTPTRFGGRDLLTGAKKGTTRLRRGALPEEG